MQAVHMFYQFFPVISESMQNDVLKKQEKFPDIKIFKEMILFAAVKKKNSGYSWKMTNFRKNKYKKFIK